MWVGVLFALVLACGNEPATTPSLVRPSPTPSEAPLPSLPAATALPTMVSEQAHPRAAALDAFLAAEASAQRFAGTVLIAQADQILFNQGYGFANLEHQAANSATTRYRLGAVSQIHTAAAVLLLVQENQLALDDPVAQYLQDFPSSEVITIHHLLSHSSGLLDFTHNPEIVSFAAARIDPRELVASLAGDGTLFTPGERHSYAHTNYFILSLLIEQVSGQPYDQFMRERLWQPAGLLNTGYDSPDVIVTERAAGYRRTEAGFVPAPALDISFLYGASGVYSDARDLWLWNQTLRQDVLLNEASRSLMFTPTLYEGDQAYSFVWQFDSFLGHDRQVAQGLTYGYVAHLAFYPSTDLTVIVLSNLDLTPTATIADYLAALTWELEAELPPYGDAAPDPLRYADYVGLYEVEPDLNIRIFTRDGRLYGQGDDSEAVALLPAGGQLFHIYGAEFAIEFIVNGAGEATGLRLTIEGEETIAPKIE